MPTYKNFTRLLKPCKLENFLYRASVSFGQDLQDMEIRPLSGQLYETKKTGSSYPGQTRGRILGLNWAKVLGVFLFAFQKTGSSYAGQIRGWILGLNWAKVLGVFLLDFHSNLRNLKSEHTQDYAQKPQRNCMFMNSTSGLYSMLGYLGWGSYGEHYLRAFHFS